MSINLVIVESPAKAKTIEGFLGKDYKVKSCFGHIRDLVKSNDAIDVKNKFDQKYIVPAEKTKVVKELLKFSKQAKQVFLASDEDREGEAISWHLIEVLKLKEKDYKRIVFHEITRKALQEAIKNPRRIDDNLVDAQKARRVLDRLVGFELSPILWKKIKPQLSAGRVQSVAVKLIVNKEEEIKKHVSSSSFRTIGFFTTQEKVHFKAQLDKKLVDKDKMHQWLSGCKDKKFVVENVKKSDKSRSPAPPFTTSTLQQEAFRKFSFPVVLTMSLAQKLYENGHITYMRTDSVTLSQQSLESIKEYITENFNSSYYQFRTYKNKSKNAQEAHEAIRPTNINRKLIDELNPKEQKLYQLIWERSVGSQMKSAIFQQTLVSINIEDLEEKFIAQGDVLKFDGFLKVYKRDNQNMDEGKQEMHDDLLPKMSQGDVLNLDRMESKQVFSAAPSRYSEASLVKTMESLGIGRPSTYAPTIATILKRGYVEKYSAEGIARPFIRFVLSKQVVKQEQGEEKSGAEKNKLISTDIASVVTQFLDKHFQEIVNYDFTAKVEKELDEIAMGNRQWTEIIEKFYHPFHQDISNADTLKRSVGTRQLGKDPKSGKPVIARLARYGPCVQIGDSDDQGEKLKFASLLKGQSIDTITLEEALLLLAFPREVGMWKDSMITAAIGRFGPYLKYNNAFYSLSDQYDVYTINQQQAISFIGAKQEENKKKVILSFQEEDIMVLKGPYGPYIKHKNKNYKIPKSIDTAKLDLAGCKEIIEKPITSKPYKKKK